MRYLVVLFLSGCYASHSSPTPDAGIPSDALCQELGSVGCLIDRPCWCWITEENQAHCRTCEETCLAEDSNCFRVGLGGIPSP